MTSLVAQIVKRLPTMWETRVQSLGREALLEKEVATHSSVLTWRIPWTEEPGGLYSPWGCNELDTTGDFTMATYSSILPGKVHGQRSLVGYSP